MPVLKNDLLLTYFARSGIAESDFADHCELSRGTVRNAGNGLNVRQDVAVAIAQGLGLFPNEAVLLYQGDPLPVDEVVALALQRQGSGLWSVSSPHFLQSDRFKALSGEWRGVQIQALPNGAGETVRIESSLTGCLRRAGRMVGGDFTLAVDVPGVVVENIALRVEGHWLGDKHYVGMYRFLEPAMQNYGTMRLELSLCKTRLDGVFDGWGVPESAWVTGEIHLRRVG